MLVAENREALLHHYLTTRGDLRAVIEGLSAALMSEASIDGWSVKDHLAHIATWDEMRAAEVIRISAGQESAWRMSAAQDDAYNTMAYELRAGMSAAQAVWELETTRSKLLDAIASATARGLDAALYGEAALVSTHEVEHAAWIRRWRAQRSV